MYNCQNDASECFFYKLIIYTHEDDGNGAFSFINIFQQDVFNILNHTNLIFFELINCFDEASYARAKYHFFTCLH